MLLDVLIEDSIYPELTERAVTTKWIETDKETMVTVPSINSITGDKLTAFAPNTIGIPYFKGKDQQPFSMEICKQLFDLSKLFEQIENMEIVAASFKAFARIAYLAAKILMNDLSSITYYEGQDIKELTVEDPDWNFLNRLKRQPDKSSFFYWYLAVQLLTKD